MREDLQEIFAAGLAAADPQRAVRRELELEDGAILAGEKRFEPRRVFVLAAGKAAGAMAKAAEELLGEKVSGGLVVTKDGHDPGPEGFETVFASHPEPDERGVEAARRVQELAESLGEEDLLLALISGGASALLADPAASIELADLKKLTSDLLKSGADIGEINTVRKHVSVLKGGGLVRLAHPAPTIALLLSDVVGDEPSSIASGLTAPDPTTLENTRRVLERYGIEPPDSVTDHLQSAEETPASDDPIFENVVNRICGGGRHAAEAAAKKAGELGYTPLLLTTTLTGDALGAASMYAAIIREVLASGNPIAPPCAIVSGGEATVTVRGSGTGGPEPGVCSGACGRAGWRRGLGGVLGRHRRQRRLDRRGGWHRGRENGAEDQGRWHGPGGGAGGQRLVRGAGGGRSPARHRADRHQRQRPAGGPDLPRVKLEGCIVALTVPFFRTASLTAASESIGRIGA